MFFFYLLGLPVLLQNIDGSNTILRVNIYKSDIKRRTKRKSIGPKPTLSDKVQNGHKVTVKKQKCWTKSNIIGQNGPKATDQKKIFGQKAPFQTLAKKNNRIYESQGSVSMITETV